MTFPMDTVEAADAVRKALAAAGYRPVPVRTGEKVPVGSGWQVRAKSGHVPKAFKWQLSTGILCDGLRAVDIDIDSPELAQQVVDIVVATLGQAPTRGRADSPRRLLVFKAANGEPGKRTMKGPKGANVEILGAGQQFVSHGKHPDGSHYEWFGDDLTATPVDDLPKIDEDQIDQLFWKLAPVLGIEEQPTAQSAPVRLAAPVAPRSASESTSIAELEELLSYIDAGCHHDDWWPVLAAIHDATGGSIVGLDLADRWSASGGTRYGGRREIERKWASFHPGQGYSKATIAKLARDAGADLSEIARRHNGTDHAEITDEDRAIAANLRVGGERIDRQTGEVVEGDAGDLQDAEDDEPEAELGGASEQEDVPEWLLDPTGVVGELAEWVCCTTSKSIRLHAIGAALVVVGTLINRKVYTASESCGGVLYLAALAKAGAGKEAPQTAIRMALDAVSTEGSMHSPWHASQQSLGKCLFDSASTVMVVDEFADELKRMKGKGAASSFAAINSSMRSLWGMGFNGTWAPAVSLTNGKLIVKKPALSMYGAATIASFRDLLNSDDVTNGMFSRFLILPRFGKVVKGPEIRGIPKLPETLRQKLLWLNHCVGDLHQVQAKSGYGELPDPILVPFTDEAAELNAANVAEQDRLIEKSDEDRVLTLYARYAEYIKRVALILAAGASPADVTQATITAEHMRWAQGLVRWSMDQFVRMVREDMSENVWQAQYKLVLGIIRDAGGSITRKVLGRKLDARVPKKVLDEILSALEADGWVRTETHKTGTAGRPTTSYRVVRKRAA